MSLSSNNKQALERVGKNTPGDTLSEEVRVIATPAIYPHELTSIDEENLLTRKVLQIPSRVESLQLLSTRGIDVPNDFRNLSDAKKINALSYMHYAFLASTEHADFFAKVVAAIRSSLLLRNPEHTRYLRFYFEQLTTLHLQEEPAAPDFLANFQGAGFIIAGPTGSGKSALIQRIRFLLGSYTIVHANTASGEIELKFVPILVVKWPNCGTLSGLLENIRNAINAELGHNISAVSGLGRVSVNKRGQRIIKLCIALNLGLLVVDGANTNSLNSEIEDIFRFISTLKNYSGIPTLLSCTYPALQALTRSGSVMAHLSSSDVLYNDYISDDEKWKSYTHAMWKLGLHTLPMPEFLPSLMMEICLGNLQLMVNGMKKIHHSLVGKSDAEKLAKLSSNRISQLLARDFRIFKEPLTVLRAYQEGRILSKVDVEIYGDFLPFELFSEPVSGPYR